MNKFFPIFRRCYFADFAWNTIVPPDSHGASSRPPIAAAPQSIRRTLARNVRRSRWFRSPLTEFSPLLRQEPGLLLQVKKAVVRKAFERGQILNPNDLSDDALFDLIRKDDNVRIIATHEIVDRGYIKAKPRREELARDLPCRLPASAGTEGKQPDQSSLTNSKRPPSQEELYWAKHENDLDCYLTQYLPYGVVPNTSSPAAGRAIARHSNSIQDRISPATAATSVAAVSPTILSTRRGATKSLDRLSRVSCS